MSVPSLVAVAAALAVLAAPLSASAQQKSGTSAKAAASKAPVKAKAAPAKKARTAAKVGAAGAVGAAAAAAAASAHDTNVVLTDADLAVAQQVHTGRIPCELGADVTVTADPNKPGFFNVTTKGASYRMHPVESRTGAIRLEDSRAGAMWLQLGNKSMLMNQKQGSRLADECQAEPQALVAAEMRKNPPKSLLDDPTPSK